MTVHEPSLFFTARRRERGFSLLGLALVLLIFGLGISLILTAAQRMTQHTRCAHLAGDLRKLAAVFQTYHQRQSVWPPATSGGSAVPGGMETLLRDTPWLADSPVGGRYAWIAPTPAAPSGAIGLTAFPPNLPLTLSRADLLYLDRLMDDGNLATGRVRTGFNGWPIYLLQDER